MTIMHNIEGPEFLDDEDFSGPSMPANISDVVINGYWDWTKRAACRKNKTKIFDKQNKAQAKVLCTQLCPVATDCLIWSLLYDEEGLWGGLTDEERKEQYPLKYRQELRKHAEKLGVLYIKRNFLRLQF